MNDWKQQQQQQEQKQKYERHQYSFRSIAASALQNTNTETHTLSLYHSLLTNPFFILVQMILLHSCNLTISTERDIGSAGHHFVFIFKFFFELFRIGRNLRFFPQSTKLDTAVRVFVWNLRHNFFLLLFSLKLSFLAETKKLRWKTIILNNKPWPSIEY